MKRLGGGEQVDALSRFYARRRKRTERGGRVADGRETPDQVASQPDFLRGTFRLHGITVDWH